MDTAARLDVLNSRIEIGFQNTIRILDNSAAGRPAREGIRCTICGVVPTDADTVKCGNSECAI